MTDEILNALAKFSFKIIPKHGPANPFLTRDDPFVQHPIGTGPYRFVRHPMYTGYVVNHIGFLMIFFSACQNW